MEKLMGKLVKRITVITGGGSGIGGRRRNYSLPRARVVIADIDEKNGQRVTNEIGAEAVFRKTDVSDPAQVETMVKFVVERYGRLDILF